MANRIITAVVSGESIKLSNRIAGAAGSHNAVSLALTFDSAWDGTTKKIYFFDTYGKTAVFRVLTADILIDGAYYVPIPSEPLAKAGEMTLTIRGVEMDGETAERIIMSASTTMRVLDALVPNADVAPIEPTPTQVEQLQGQIDEILETIVDAINAAAAAHVSEVNAANSATSASGSASAASGSATAAASSASSASSSASAASTSAGAAASSVTAAANSASSAAASATTASTKASEAAASATNAANSAATATTKASEAASSKTAAETAQAGAISAKNDAITAKTAAETARTGAEAARDSAQDIVDAFDNHAESLKSDFDSNAAAANTIIDGKVTTATNAATAAQTAQGLSEGARDASVTAKNEAVTAKTAAESAKTAAKTSEVNAKTSETNAATSAANAASSASSASGSKADALASKNAAATSASSAATSETKAKTSETNAKTAETGAVAAKTAAESAKSIAVTAKDNAVLAKTAAETAQGLAETAKSGADAAKSGADTAKAGAESARDTAITAKNDAVTAKTAAQSAQTAAETAKGQAETARSGAQTAATTAGNKALDSEAFGAGTRNGVAVGTGDPAYQNNAKYYKDQAGEIVGGDFPTKTEAQGYANTAQANAKTYTDAQIAAIPPVDISGKADKTYVDNKVKTDVPAGAVFTDTLTTINGKTGAIAKSDIVALGIPAQDTVYEHPATHSADMIVDGTTNKAFTATEKTKLAGVAENANNYAHPTTAGNKHIPSGGASGQILRYSASGTAVWGADNDTITTVNGKTGAIAKADIVALGIPAQDTVVDISGKVDKVAGKGLSTEDYTTAEKTKLAGVAENANNYAHPTTAGNKHIPSGGASGQILRYSASGTAVWGADNDTITTVNGKTGAISKADIVALGIPAQDTVYTHPANHPPSIITQDASHRFVTDAEKSTWNSKANASHTHTKANITDFPASMTPTAHKSTHSVGGADALIDADIGLTPAVATAFGLTGNPQVADALERLSNAVNPLQYVWNKYTKAYQEHRATATERTLSTSSSPTQYQVYTSVSVNPETGVISGVGSAKTWAGTASRNCDATGEYLNGAGVWYFVVGMISLIGGNLIASSCSTITARAQVKTFIEQLASYSPTAYPQDGVLNDFYYKYIGRPQHIGVGSAAGSYTGTGTYGSTSKNSLTLDFTPKKISIINSTGIVFGELIINGSTVYGYSNTTAAGAFVALTGSISGNTISWYNATNAANQLNTAATTYLYVAEG